MADSPFPREAPNELGAVFGTLISAMSGGGDRGNAFPQSDAEDMRNGARFIPGRVTLDRRAGKKVEFHHSCSSSCCWYWQFDDGSRTYHWDPMTYDSIGQRNNGPDWTSESGTPAGACPECGNPHTHGGEVSAEEVGY